MGKPVHLKFSGFNNRAGDTALPVLENRSQRARNAVNVQFDNQDNLIFPRWGTTKKYSGTVKSVYETPFITLFVEGGNLKKLNSDNTATTLRTGVSDARMGYTHVAETVYFSNGSAAGKVVNGIASEWGVEVPPRQPDCTVTATGDMFAGDYRVAITWIGSDGTESGTGESTQITVAEGGGIRVDNFPAPPAYVSKVAIWLSSVNGEDLYLYGEYPYWLTSLSLTKQIGTISLETQFGYPPIAGDILQAHYGRIYYPIGNRLYWTATRRYGMQFAGQYWQLDSEIQTVVSVPSINSLIVGTKNHIYRYDGIDGDTPPNRTQIQDCGSVKYSECYHRNGDMAFFMSARGFIQVTVEGMKELTYQDLAIENFESGSCTVIEREGLEYLVFVGQNPTANPLIDTKYAAAETLRLGY